MSDNGSPSPPLAARLSAFALTAGICLVLFAVVAWSSTWLANTPLIGAALPHTATLLMGIAFLMAQTSLAGLWWAGSRWPSYLKTLAAAAACGIVWALLLWLLPGSSLHDPEAAGWAASLATQAVFTALATALLYASSQPASGNSHRFSILFLLAWTAVLAVMLGVGRSLAQRAGWSAEGILHWEYLLQLQVIGLANAVLAVGVFAALRLAPGGGWQAMCAWLVVGLMTFCAPLAMFALFTDVGAEILEIVWLFAAEGTFLIAFLLPQEYIAQRALYQSSTVASNSDSAASDSARASSR